MASIVPVAQIPEHPIATTAASGELHLAHALRSLGWDVDGNPDLQETPGRWLRAMRELTSGYLQSAEQVLSKRFACDGVAGELVILRDIEFTSLCEHHLLPFNGVAHVGYMPAAYVVGLSKLARLVDVFARRLQLQERMTAQIASAIETHLASPAIAVAIEAHHSCMGCRGVRKKTARMITTSMRGKAKTDPALRAEFLRLAGL